MYRNKLPGKLQKPESVEHGFAYALFLLGLRLRTEGEIRKKMTERGYVPDVIRTTLEQLIQYEYVNDARLIEVVIENFQRYKTYGFYFIKKKLFEKSFPKELVEFKLSAILTTDRELEIVLRYIKKEGLVVLEGDYDARRKVLYKLGSRGFRSEVISMALSGIVPE